MGSLALLWRSDSPGEAAVKIQGHCAGTKLWLLGGVVPWAGTLCSRAGH